MSFLKWNWHVPVTCWEDANDAVSVPVVQLAGLAGTADAAPVTASGGKWMVNGGVVLGGMLIRWTMLSWMVLRFYNVVRASFVIPVDIWLCRWWEDHMMLGGEGYPASDLLLRPWYLVIVQLIFWCIMLWWLCSVIRLPLCCVSSLLFTSPCGNNV